MMAQNKSPAVICVFGITGAGKSSFINDASGDDLKIGHGQMSCTDEVVVARKFLLNGREVCLIDTPGFDDTMKSDSEILRMIGSFLAESYGKGTLLTGMIYLHRITDVRFGGVSKRNFSVFRELCGPQALKNFIICTNFWSNPPSEVHVAREKELITTPAFFHDAIAKGAKVARYVNRGRAEAHEIVRMCLGGEAEAVQMQLETARGAKLIETSAGRELGRELGELLRQNTAEFFETSQMLEEATRKMDDETQQELKEVQKENTEKIHKLMRNIDLLEANVASERERNQFERRRYANLWEQQQQEIRAWAQKYQEIQAQSPGAMSPYDAAQLDSDSQQFLQKIGGKRHALKMIAAELVRLGAKRFPIISMLMCSNGRF